MKICVLIPTYNEEEKIGQLIKNIRDSGFDVIVVDDGSDDRTADISRREGAFLIRHNENRGKGASLRSGFDYIIKSDYDGVITMDGDGQHDPNEIPKFIEKASRQNAGIVIGNRMGQIEDMPVIRRLTNRGTSFFVSLASHQKIADSQCGYRLIKREVLEKIAFLTSKYETESEILIEASRWGYKIIPVSIKTIYRNQPSQINPVVDTLRFIRLMARTIFRRGQMKPRPSPLCKISPDEEA